MYQLVARMIRASVLLTACLGWAPPAPADLIDRVLAVVAGQVIMLSDVRGVMQLGLVDTAGARDAQSAALTQLIERQLILAEVDRYVVEEPTPDAIERRLVRVRAIFSSEAQFGEALAEAGLSDADLRQIVRDDIRIDAYLDQRFAAAVQPTDEELLTYYRRHEGDFTQGGRIVPFADVRETVGSRLAAERRQELIADWVTTLGDGSNVIRLDLSAR